MLYLSRVIKVREDIMHYDLSNILSLDRSLIIFNEEFRSFYICLISDDNIRPIKLKNGNKWNMLLFDKVDEPLFYIDDIKQPRYGISFVPNSFLIFMSHCHSKTSFIIKHEMSYYYYSLLDEDGAKLFYRTLENSITV